MRVGAWAITHALTSSYLALCVPKAGHGTCSAFCLALIHLFLVSCIPPIFGMEMYTLCLFWHCLLEICIFDFLQAFSCSLF